MLAEEQTSSFREKSNPSCPVCGGTEVSFLISQLPGAHLPIETEFQISQCQGCRCAFVANPPTAEELARVYNSDFFSTSQQSVQLNPDGSFTKASEESPIFINAQKRVKQLATMRSGGRLLDVGCGKGFFVKLASEHFQAEGADISEDAASYGRTRLGVHITAGDFQSADLPEKSFDVITLWDVLASFPDPVAVIAKCSELLKPGGLVVMTVPDIESLCFKLSRRYWPLLIPPINLFFFSRRSMKELLAKAGFELDSYRHEGKILSSNFVLRKLGRILNIGFLDSEHVRLPFVPRLYLNLGDIATVVGIRSE